MLDTIVTHPIFLPTLKVLLSIGAVFGVVVAVVRRDDPWFEEDAILNKLGVPKAVQRRITYPLGAVLLLILVLGALHEDVVAIWRHVFG